MDGGKKRSDRSSIEVDATVAVTDQGVAADPSITRVRALTSDSFPSSNAPATLTRGQALDDYVILNVIGEGGMGVVYAAWDNSLNRKVAIKVLRAAANDGIAASEARLLREAQAMAQLSHPNVVTVYKVGTVHGHVYLAMEYIDGRTLTAWLREAPHRPQEIIDVLVKAGRGLEAAHQVGLVHRDFKPDNILIGRDSQVRVTDFGLARTAETLEIVPERRVTDPMFDDSQVRRTLPSPDVTGTQMLMGTPAYMAAERYLGAPLDARADQFSYCATLYEALFGKRAFAGDTLAEVRGNILAGQMVEPPRTKGVSREVRALLVRGLSTEPADRFPSMSALLNVLARKPATQRTFIIVAVLLVVVAGLVGFAALMQTRSAPSRCEGSQELLAEHWNPSRKEAIHRSLSNSGLPVAETLWHTVERQLDSYASSWVSMHHASCEATRRGEQSAATLDRRMLCLDRRRRELTILTDTLIQADAVVAENAVKAVGGLSPVADCADLEALMAEVDAPTARRSGIASVRAELDRANVYLAIDPKRGLAMGLETLKRAEALHFPPIEAETRLLIGRMAESAGMFKEAEENLVIAEHTAEASRADAIKTRARIELVYVVGYELQRYPEAHLWARLAEAGMKRGNPNSELAARFLIHEGAVYFASGKYDKSFELQDKALTLERALHGNDHPDVALALDHVCNSLLALGDVTKALEGQREAVAIFGRTIGLEHPGAAEAINNLGNAYAEAEDLPSAKVQFKKALALWERALGQEHPRVAVAVSNMGAIELRGGSAASALPYFERALAIEEKAFGPQSPSIAATLAHVGTVRLMLGTFKEAIVPLERALTIWKAAGTETAEVGQAAFSLAQALWATGQTQLALEQAQRGLELAATDEDAKEIRDWLDARPGTAVKRPAPPQRPRRRR
jgi:eukaryotic-like serine/threonine-protein kinase